MKTDFADDINVEEWVAGFNVFLKGGNSRSFLQHFLASFVEYWDKLMLGEERELREFCFYIYDLNGDGYISRQCPNLQKAKLASKCKLF